MRTLNTGVTMGSALPSQSVVISTETVGMVQMKNYVVSCINILNSNLPCHLSFIHELGIFVVSFYSACSCESCEQQSCDIDNFDENYILNYSSALVETLIIVMKIIYLIIEFEYKFCICCSTHCTCNRQMHCMTVSIFESLA